MTHAAFARRAQYFNIAANMLYLVNQLDKHNFTAVLEECKLLWDQGEHFKAIDLLKALEIRIPETAEGLILCNDIRLSLFSRCTVCTSIISHWQMDA